MPWLFPSRSISESLHGMPFVNLSGVAEGSALAYGMVEEAML